MMRSSISIEREGLISPRQPILNNRQQRLHRRICAICDLADGAVEHVAGRCNQLVFGIDDHAGMVGGGVVRAHGFNGAGEDTSTR